jgi:hypothetical protein
MLWIQLELVVNLRQNVACLHTKDPYLTVAWVMKY